MSPKPASGVKMPRVGNKLAGRALFLSASVPSPERAEIFRRLPDAQREIEDAVISLARAVFAEGGRLVFGGHPSISPLVAFVAGEYASAEPQRRAEVDRRQLDDSKTDGPPVIIYQLDAFRTDLPDATIDMEKFGLARIEWCPTVQREKGGEWSHGQSKYPGSLREMRSRIFNEERLAGAVFIGGMEGVLQEAGLFTNAERQRGAAFVVRRTGGAAELLAKRESLPGIGLHIPADRIRVIDDEVLSDVAPRLRTLDNELIEVGPRVTPYSVVMQSLVHIVARDHFAP